ncbi:hypothetical protein [Bifidobacterium phage PMBT6]|nr:hypothetical protein [Bifidobacterium phage PMBT6]QDF14863.1 hypothetical protein [Bifidobacterium phage PMBT6]
MPGMHGREGTVSDLRREYAAVLHELDRQLHRVDLVAFRIIRRGRAEGRQPRPAFAPALVDLPALDLEDSVQETIQDVAAGIGLWGGWRTLLPRMASRMTDLCARHDADRRLADLQGESRRMTAWLGAPSQDSRPLIGLCPQCHAPVHRLGSGVICPCGWASPDPRPAWETLAAEWGRLHVTLTPADASRWIRDNLGETVPRNTVSVWLKRGQLPGAAPLGDGYWRIPVASIARRVSRRAESKRL